MRFIRHTSLDNGCCILSIPVSSENNHTLYSPHSDFKTQLQNRKDLYNDHEEISYAYKINKIEKISILEKLQVLEEINLSESICAALGTDFHEEKFKKI